MVCRLHSYNSYVRNIRKRFWFVGWTISEFLENIEDQFVN
jgi:hypothetical protein